MRPYVSNPFAFAIDHYPHEDVDQEDEDNEDGD